MHKIQSAAVSQELQALLKDAKDGPISVESGGATVAIMLSPQAYVDLVQRSSARRPQPRRALTLDSNELFGLHGDVFCNDGP